MSIVSNKGIITWAAGLSFAETPDHIEQVYPEGHIRCPIPSCGGGGLCQCKYSC